jgi:uncharacterized SAM-binding protein YcdF (DUF218 family)
MARPQHAARRKLAQRVATQLAQLLGGIFALLVLGVALASILVLLQARRNEARRVDALILLPQVADTAAGVDQALDLYRRGYTQQLIVGGPAAGRVRAALIERGLPATAVVGGDESTDPMIFWEHTARIARQNGVTSVLLVTSGAHMLRELKIARDLGLTAYATPVPGPDPDFPTAVRASLGYWAYVLARR